MTASRSRSARPGTAGIAEPEAGLGATAHVPGQPDTFEGWEGSAVAPEKLGDYLRDLNHLYDEFGYSNEDMPSLSGEHGGGQSRGELLGRMFGGDLVRAFEELKAIFDPGNQMNPGKVVHPGPAG